MNDMKCKMCHPIYGNKLRQTGWPNPRSYECVICGKAHLHDDSGLPTKDSKGEYMIVCPVCYSSDVTKDILYSYKCNVCSTIFNVKQ